MLALLLDWLTMLARWWHVLAGIAWVGTSFYFNWFDSRVKPTDQQTLRENNRGVLHEVHGGNFYYHEQYFPNALPPQLHAHAWPAKMTFLSGLLLLVLIYWLGASTYMIDTSVAALTQGMAIALSIGSIVLCWFLYNTLCTLYASNRLIFAIMAAISALAAFGFQHVYGGRAAYISVGVMLGSLMGLNVWLVIAPKSIRMQKQLRAEGQYDLDDGFQAKRRSQHNNYFTLPVLVTMVSNHFPTAYNHPMGWLVLSLLMFVGWGIRHALNVWYKEERKMIALYGGVILALVSAIAITLYRPQMAHAKASTIDDNVALKIVHERCVSCHAQQPQQSGFAAAPQGLILESLPQIRPAADKIYQRVVVTRDMPLGNITMMTEEERAQLGQWLQAHNRSR